MFFSFFHFSSLPVHRFLRGFMFLRVSLCSSACFCLRSVAESCFDASRGMEERSQDTERRISGMRQENKMHSEGWWAGLIVGAGWRNWCFFVFFCDSALIHILQLSFSSHETTSRQFTHPCGIQILLKATNALTNYHKKIKKKSRNSVSMPFLNLLTI